MKKEYSTHEKKILNRVKDKIKLSGPQWHALLEDMKNGEIKRIICFKYNIPLKYYKWVKRIVGEM